MSRTAPAPEFVIEYLDPRDLKAHPQNWRGHPEIQRDALRESLAEFGYLAAPIWNRASGHILDGHARVELAVASEERLIPVRVIDVPEAQEKRILASFDRIGELRERDDAALSALLQELALTEGGLPAGWGEADLAALIAEMEPESGLVAGADPDAIPEEVETRCKAGDLWELRHHRLLCGSSAEADSVRRLMGGKEADLCFTSPPYGQQREYGGNIPDWPALMRGVFQCLPMKPEGQVLVNLGLIHREGEWEPYWETWIDSMREWGWRRFGWYVWDQGPGLPGDWNGRLAPAHEFIFHFNRVAERARKTHDCKGAGEKRRASQKGLRQADGTVSEFTHAGRAVQEHKIPDSVLRVMRHKARGIEVQHPAVFPVQLAVEVMEAFSDPGDLAYEPFAGAGTAIVAAEQTARVVFACEIEPKYCDLILARWEAATGREAVRLE